MTDDLVKRLNTAGGFDSPWLREQLVNWDHKAEQQKADFMEHMYQCSGRHQEGHPMYALFTGLWQDFCIKEAGPYCRDDFFKRLEFIEKLNGQQQENAEAVTSQD